MKNPNSFSLKQLQVMGWYLPGSPYERWNGVIADGAIRSGKSFALATGFVLWAMGSFDRERFAICGKTVQSIRRNILGWLVPQLLERGYLVSEQRTENVLVIERGGVVNWFYLFGGYDEGSQDLIQGITLAGALLDEVALMPESFVNQATGRCSVEGSKLWFSCNPDAPNNFFKKAWIDRAEMKKLLYLHFTMEDNPSLSAGMRQRYRELYAGVFFSRLVLGLWVQADGAIYPMFQRERHVVGELPKMRRVWVGVDYGHTNPTVFLLVGEGVDRKLYVLREYYHSGREDGTKSPVFYAEALRGFLDRMWEEMPGVVFDGVFVDPSASGFMALVRERIGVRVRKAKNDVLEGIGVVGGLVEGGGLLVGCGCEETVREFGSYVWDRRAQAEGRDQPVKANDHCMDALRYAVMGDDRHWRRMG